MLQWAIKVSRCSYMMPCYFATNGRSSRGVFTISVCRLPLPTRLDDSRDYVELKRKQPHRDTVVMSWSICRQRLSAKTKGVRRRSTYVHSYVGQTHIVARRTRIGCVELTSSSKIRRTLDDYESARRDLCRSRIPLGWSLVTDRERLYY